MCYHYLFSVFFYHFFTLQLYQYSTQPTTSKTNGGNAKNGEHLVHYILAKPLHTDVGSMGIPAFDQGKSLVRFSINYMFMVIIISRNSDHIVIDKIIVGESHW